MSISSDLRAYIKELKPICECCKKNPTEEIHHIDSNPKNNQVKNLMAICKKCHRSPKFKREIHPKKVIRRILKQYLRSSIRKYKKEPHIYRFVDDLVDMECWEFETYFKKRCPYSFVCLKRKTVS